MLKAAEEFLDLIVLNGRGLDHLAEEESFDIHLSFFQSRLVSSCHMKDFCEITFPNPSVDRESGEGIAQETTFNSERQRFLELRLGQN